MTNLLGNILKYNSALISQRFTVVLLSKESD